MQLNGSPNQQAVLEDGGRGGGRRRRKTEEVQGGREHGDSNGVVFGKSSSRVPQSLLCNHSSVRCGPQHCRPVPAGDIEGRAEGGGGWYLGDTEDG